MRAKLQKWGNSTAIRLPVKVLEEANLTVNQDVEIKVEAGSLVICPIETTPTYSLDELLMEITPDNVNIDREWESARPVGRELP